MYNKTLSLIIAFIFLSAFLTACSGNNSPMSPGLDNCDQAEATVSETDERTMVGMYEVEINTDLQTCTIEQIDRIGSYHVPLTIFPGVLSIDSYEWGPPFKADIRIKHPAMTSNTSLFDPRVIAVLPAKPGVSMDYPALNVQANNAVLLNPDGYVNLWDVSALPGNANPFIAYFKETPNRLWATYEQTIQWELDLTGFDGPIAFVLIVDVSSNYPNPAFPGIHNSPEPVELTASIGEGLTPGGGSALLEVDVLDWQGENGIGGVQIESPALFDGVIDLSYGCSPDLDVYSYSIMVSNEKNAPAGDYNLLVSSWDNETGIHIYNEFVASVASSDPVFDWVYTCGGIGDDDGLSVKTDSNGDVYVTGRFFETVDFGNGNPITTNGGWDTFLVKVNSNGSFQWVKTWGGPGEDKGLGVAIDSNGNVYSIGYFSETVDFGNGDLISSNGGWDAFLVKTDSNGNFEWVKTWGGSGNEYGHEVTITSNGDMYVTGCFEETVDFGDGNLITSNGYRDAFLIKLDTNGSFEWVKTWGGFGYDRAEVVIIDSYGDIHVTGFFEQTVDFGDGNPITSNGSRDGYLLKIDSNSNFERVKTWGGPYTENGEVIATNDLGDMYISGFFEGTVDFGDGNPITSNGRRDGYLLKLDLNGNFEWVKTWGGVEDDYVHQVATDSIGGVYVTGSFHATVDFGDGNPITSNGDYDIFELKLDSNGNLEWLETWGGIGREVDYGFTISSGDDLFVTGSFQDTVDFGDGNPITSHGMRDIFLRKLSN